MPRKTEKEQECCQGHCCGHCGGAGRLVLGGFIIMMGVSWLGHDLGWWSFTLPWFPLAVTLAGIAMVIGWHKKNC